MDSPDPVEEEQERRILAGEIARPLGAGPSLAQLTGQSKRFWRASAVIIAGGGVMLFGLWNLDSPWSFEVTMGGALLALGGLVAQCLSVRCPKCGVATVWHAYRHGSQADAVWRAAFQERCPNCRHDPWAAHFGTGDASSNEELHQTKR